MRYKEFLANLQEADIQARADYKLDKKGHKTHKEIVFHDGTQTNDEKEQRIQKESKDTVVKDKDGKVVSWKHEGDWKKNDPKKNPEGKVHNLAGQALKKTKELNKEEVEAIEEEQLDEKSEQARRNKTMKNSMDASRGARWKVQNKVSADDVRDWDGKHKTTQAQNKAIGRALRNEEAEEIEENAPVAPSLVKHRISVTVSDPDHPAVSKRKEKIQKTVIVTHSDNKEGARAVGEKYYKKKGYRVHDSHHAGMVNEEVALDENDHDPYYEAQQHKKDAEKAHKEGDHKSYHMFMAAHHDSMAHWSSNRGRHHVADQHMAKAEQHQDWAHKPNNEGTEMSQLTYKEFLAKLSEQLLEYTPGPGGVTRVQGRSYGAQYHDPEGDDDADDKPKAKPADAPKRGRGRPAGSKSGANQKVTSGKSYGGVQHHSLNLPNTNR